MEGFKAGDTVFFAQVGSLVNEGVVEAVEGAFLKVKSRLPRTTYVRASHAFATREALMKSESYHSAWFGQHMRHNARMGMPSVAFL